MIRSIPTIFGADADPAISGLYPEDSAGSFYIGDPRYGYTRHGYARHGNNRCMKLKGDALSGDVAFQRVNEQGSDIAVRLIVDFAHAGRTGDVYFGKRSADDVEANQQQSL